MTRLFQATHVSGSVASSWLRRAALTLAIALAAATLAAETAQACTPAVDANGATTSRGGCGGADLLLPALTLPIVAMSIGWSVADTVSYGMGTPFSVGWAVSDFIVGSLTITASAALFSIVDNGQPGALGYGIGYVALGVYNIAHGIWSLIEGPNAARQSSARFRVLPTAGGAQLSLSGTF